MAFIDYRDSCKNSIKHEFDVERFAYDVFAFMLRICGFPERKIPISNLKNNLYIADDFVMNVGLSALPIALYSRDEWRFVFEGIFGESGDYNILEIQNYLESFIAYSGEFEEDDTLSKIQFSLALYNEYMLFLQFKGIENCIDKLPKLWSDLCKELYAQSEEFDEANESSLTMCPDVSEAWIKNFITNFAIPYGNSADVSDKFSAFTLECKPEENDFFPERAPLEEDNGAVPSSGILEDITTAVLPLPASSKCYFPDVRKSEEYLGPPTINQFGSKDNLKQKREEKEDKNAVRPPDDCTSAILLNIANSREMNYTPHVKKSEEYLVSPPILKQKSPLERRPQARHKNGLRYVLDKCRGTKRGRSHELGVDFVVGKMTNFALAMIPEKENISPENRDTKRRRRSSGKNKLE